jgi:hypothetical protein
MKQFHGSKNLSEGDSSRNVKGGGVGIENGAGLEAILLFVYIGASHWDWNTEYRKQNSESLFGPCATHVAELKVS